MSSPGPGLEIRAGAAPATAAPARTAGPGELDVMPLSLRAAIAPSTLNDQERTVELIWTTGADVERYDWMRGERYIERLSLDPAHVRLDRLNDGGPLLDAHSAWSVSDQLGTVVPGSASVSKPQRQGRARVRFSKRAAVEPVWQDVRDQIVRSVSVGYRVYAVKETAAGKNNALPIREAIDWEPFEVSMVPMPADAGAHTRGEASAETNRCRVVTGEEKPMPDEERSETVVETPLAAPPEPEPEPTEPNERDEGAQAERTRVQGILQACRAGRLPQSFADRLISDGVTLVDAQTRVLQEIERRDPGTPRANSRGREVAVGDDPLVHVRAGIENALLHRCAPSLFELADVGRDYRGMRLLDVARTLLNARGVRTTAMSRMQLAGVALGLDVRSGMHTTSDFVELLADVAGKMLRRAYEQAPQTFGPISRRTTLPDFKPAKRNQLGDAPQLLEIDEHGEFKHGTIGEGKEQYQLATYGRIFGITRKTLVNDDLEAFSRVPQFFGRAARNLESNLVWKQITSNPDMGDGTALFHADHGNLAGSGAAISVATIGTGRAAMRTQKGLDGETLLNIMPRFLIVPAAIETEADKFVSNNLVADSPGNINPFAGRLSVIPEPRLDADSATAWYLGADPDQIDMIEYATLEGEDGPMVESRVGFDIDGLEVKARHDFAAKVLDWRGLYKNAGA